MKSTKFTQANSEKGSALICVLGTILVLSLAGAGVLMNCTTRYNATSKQVKGWKEALYAAEAGGDLAFAEIRKFGLDQTMTAGFATADGWATPGPSPLPTTYSWNRGYTTAAPTFGEDNGLSAKVTVDRFGLLPGSTWIGYFRIRSVGTALVRGLKRTGMEDALTQGGTHFAADGATRGNGDSLLRKIDFNFDHFIATYGYGDALPSAGATSGNGKSAVAVSNSQFSQVTRRVELIAIPVMPIEGAVKTSGSFRGTMVDSYDSKNGAYKGTNPAPPYDVDAHDGDVVVGNSTFSATNTIYGDVATNGGTATTTNVTGVVDNNVPTIVPLAVPGVPPIPNLPGPSPETGTPNTISPPNRTLADGRRQTTFWYTYSSFDDVTVNPVKTTAAVTLANGTTIPNNTPIDTIVNIYVTGDAGEVTVNKGATVNIYFRGNMADKARNIENNNVDGPGTAPNYNGVWVPNYIDSGISASPRYVQDPATPYVPSTLVSRAGHCWYYGISPTDGSSRTIAINPSGTVWAAFYAPSHDFSTNGNPDIYGVVVAKSFYMNGNTLFHFDKQLLLGGYPTDYRVASYVEDIR